MRCCPICYAKVKPTVFDTVMTDTKLEIKYVVICPRCGFGCHKEGSVVLDYDEETMTPLADDRGLRSIIRKWDSILRDPEAERVANI